MRGMIRKVEGAVLWKKKKIYVHLDMKTRKNTILKVIFVNKINKCQFPDKKIPTF